MKANNALTIAKAVVISLVFLANSLYAAETLSPQGTFPNATDPVLQRLLDERIAGRGVGELIRNKYLSITLVDITDIESPKLAHINGSDTLYAASLPKLAILLAVFEEVHLGNLQMTPALYNSVEQMIRHSSNRQATYLYDLVGAPRIEQILRSERYRLYDEDSGGGLWIGKPYGKKPAWKRDPLKNVSHGASGIQVARFYFMLEHNELANPGYCRVMKEILGKSAINHKFVKGLSNHRPEAKIFRKSGTWRNYHSDSALVERADGRKYIAVALSHNKNGGKLLEKIIVDLDTIIDQYHSF
jgi:beta-lactamase class A